MICVKCGDEIRPGERRILVQLPDPYSKPSDRRYVVRYKHVTCPVEQPPKDAA